jgi:hypothetical protein
MELKPPRKWSARRSLRVVAFRMDPQKLGRGRLNTALEPVVSAS